MSDFAVIVAGWHDFFMLAGTASATLIGLLLVALSLRTDIRTTRADSALRTTASQSFRSYLALLLFALYFLIPDPSPASIAWPVILTSLAFLVSLLRDAQRYRALLTKDRPIFIWHYLVPTACYVAATAVGVGMFRNEDAGIYWLVSVIAFLLTIPTSNAWRMTFAGDEQTTA
jgi:hypothetical protein